MDAILAIIFGAACGVAVYALTGGADWQFMLPIIFICAIIGCGVAALTTR